jgi:uncharacterized protein (TIGR02246 family)
MVRPSIALVLAPFLAVAAEQKPPAPPGGDPMAGWVPPKLASPAKDKKEIQALYQAMEAAGKRGDIEAAAALIDFPVLMATDDSKGEGLGETWERERWIELMKPFYAKPMTDMKITHKPDIFLLSDSLATVNDVTTMKMGGRTITTRNTTILVRRDGKWLVKAMAEAGWGDLPAMQPPPAPPGASPDAASPGTAGGASPAPEPAR